MAANYLHGVEVIEQTIGPRTIRVVKSAVIALVGVAPKGPTNELTLVQSANDAAQFGYELPGFTIPETLRIIQSQGSGLVVVVNVYNPATHNENELSETKSVPANRVVRMDHPLIELDNIENQAGEPLIEGDHYTIGENGDITLTSLAVNGATAVTAVGATAEIQITGGSAGTGNEFVNIVFGSLSFLASAVPWATSNNATAAAIAAAITTNIGNTPDLTGWSATSSGQKVLLHAPEDLGATMNGQTLNQVYVAGDVTETHTAFAGGVTGVDGLTPTTSITVDYWWFNINNVTEADIIGGIVSGNRTGLKCFEECFTRFGFNGKIFISPLFSVKSSIASELRVCADKYMAVAILDGATDWDVTEAIAERNELGSNFNTSDDRALLVYPPLLALDPYRGGDKVIGYSAFMAGGIAANDLNRGYWYSTSSVEILALTGVTRIIEGDPTRANTEANLLNENGIITYLNFGGPKFWGNRSAAWPTNTAPANFYSIRRTADVIHESLIYGTLQYIDLPIGDALIDAIRDAGKAFISTQIQRGALVDGDVTYDPADNPPSETGNGHLAFRVTYMPPPPFERGTYLSYIDINLLKSLGQSSQ